MKRILPLVLAAAMLLSLIPAVSAAELPADETAVPEPTEAETAAEETEAPTEPETAETVRDPQPAEPTAAPEKETADLAVTGASIPKITRAVPSQNGVKLTYTAFEGADKYMIFCEKPAGGWKKLGESATTSFEHKLTPNNTAYKYTVRAADKNGKFVSGYDKAGYTYACLATPVLNRVENVFTGHKLIWDPVDGAAFYMVYIKAGNQWEALGVTDKTYYINENAVSGESYSYTVRCWDNEKHTGSSFYVRRGISGGYIAAPRITGFTPAKGGVTVKWSASKGAPRCSVFMKNNGRWKKLCNTSDTSFTHTGLTDHTVYTYTVRCIDKNGAFCSGYDTAGSNWMFLAPPQISGIADGKITWNGMDAASFYRVYRKEFRKGWTAIATTGKTAYTDTSAAADTLYTYTVRGLDNDFNLITHFNSDDTYYYNGKPASGTITVDGAPLLFIDGKVRQGYVTIDDKMYYYNAKGVLQKNGLVGSSKEGWRYADKDGVIQLNYTGLATNSAGTWYVKNGKLYRDTSEAITWNGADYIIIRGRAHLVSDEEEETLFRAIKLTNSVAPRSYSKADRLEIMFDYIKDAYTEMNPRLPDYTGMDWPIIYANDMLINGEGNCLSYAAEFCFIAKAIGYDEVYACHSGGHGWSEIDGLVYDPEWSRHNFNYSYYALSYYTTTDQDYLGAISPGYDWMHVKICAHL